MGYSNDSSIRSLLNPKSEAKMNQAVATADILKKMVAEKGMIDVSEGAVRELGVSKEKLNQALSIMDAEGYPIYARGVSQMTNPCKQTNILVLCLPGTEHKDIYAADAKIDSVGDYISYDGGETFKKSFVYPSSMDSSRLQIRYDDEGGKQKNGVIELRRNIADLSLGESNYAQVRILVDGTHYLKGMAVYSDDMPDGVDVIFNTNKKSGTPMTSVLKPISDDPDNPFSSLIKEHGGQSEYIDSDGNKKLSLINKRAEESDWSDWSDALPSQFLSKQNQPLIEKQLTIAKNDKISEFEEICSLTNPTVKKSLLQSFAEDCDAAAVHLKAAALPRQKYHVILPVTSMKDDEVYAPNYHDGETVALILYPHGGTFEIPILKVNNKQTDAEKLIGSTAVDAIGINSNVAERLSGADFDGDTVMVIPCNSNRSSIHITSTPPLDGLVGFDPKEQYGPDTYEEGSIRLMKDPITGTDNTQKQMGVISNLITDMTLKGATEDELARAVRHSMVVIDAAKHKLNYKQSEIDNDIPALKQKYQGRVSEDGHYHEGAATLISQVKSSVQVKKRVGTPHTNPETGQLIFKEVDETYVDKKGKTKNRTQSSTKMAETSDAYTLSSGTPQEELYADYANKMKSLANEVRLEILSTGRIEYSASAKAKYQEQYDSLMAKLNVSLMNAPRERQAQLIANTTVKAKIQDNPDLAKKSSKSQLKKVKQQALASARLQVGAQQQTIDITDKEWEAIQSDAISENKLTKILRYADSTRVR